MALGVSLLVIAAGAILRYAYHPTDTHGFNLGTIGAILMIIGIIGAVASVVDWVFRHRTRRTQPASTTSTTVATPAGASEERQVVERSGADSQANGFRPDWDRVRDTR